jgi:SET domain
LGGLGGFAMVRITKGQVIFAIPRELILSSSSSAALLSTGTTAIVGNSSSSSSHQITTLAQDPRITAETLLCVDMVWKENASASKKDYLMSLSAASPTNTLLVTSELQGTNVGSQLMADQIELTSQLSIIKELLPNSVITIQELTQARAIYNSRRYPLHFAPTTSSATAACGDIVASIPMPTVHDDDDYNSKSIGGESRPVKKTKLEKTLLQKNDDRLATPPAAASSAAVAPHRPPPLLPRAVYDPTQGCLCPLLDVLNHQSGRDHLQFEISSTTLYVITNYDIEQGYEIYSNYDCDNNDQCLLQFGFVISSSLTSTSGSSPSCIEANYNNDMDVFTVQVGKCGPKFDLRASIDIPHVLLSDGGYGLEAHLMTKQTVQSNATLSINPFVQEYMKSQRRLLLVLLEKVRQVIQVNEEEEAEADSTEEDDDNED